MRTKVNYRKIWSDAHGEIPRGHHIHHKDGNSHNNELDNLECLSQSDHYWEHKLRGDDWEAEALRRSWGFSKLNPWDRWGVTTTQKRLALARYGIDYDYSDEFLIKIPSRKRRDRWDYTIFIDKFETENGRHPSDEEVANGLGWGMLRLRNTKFQPEQNSIVVLAGLMPNTEDRISYEEDYSDLYKAIDKLSDRQKSIIEGRFFHGYKFKEIAEDMGVSVKTIERDYSKIKKILKKLLISCRV